MVHKTPSSLLLSLGAGEHETAQGPLSEPLPRDDEFQWASMLPPVLGPVGLCEARGGGGQFVLRGLILQNSCLRSGLRSVQGDQGDEERVERVAGADFRADLALS